MNITRVNRQVRYGVFETNSSSTHSLTIHRRKAPKFTFIPKNDVITIDGSYVVDTDDVYDEFGKLNYIVYILASSIFEMGYDEDKFLSLTFDQMVQLDWFKWIADVINEVSNTVVKYVIPEDAKNNPKAKVPYYPSAYDTDEALIDIITGNNTDMLHDEAAFKARMKEIIYDPEMIISEHTIEW
ncbi:hypothetical protein J6A31_05760 [bacterium]|nr:hypothetical protein [bacterium]